MALNTGVTACVLRSLIQQNHLLIAWFAPIRGPRFSGIRTIFGGQQIDSSSPDQDIRVVIQMSSEQADDLLLLGIIAKLEKSPVHLIDCGPDGTDPVLLRGRIPQMAAGSMGLVIPVELMPVQLQALEALIPGSSITFTKLWILAAGIHDQFPASMRGLLPTAPADLGAGQDPRVWSLACMVTDLVMITPLVTGSFSSSFGRSTRADLQDLASFGGFSSLKLRELVEADLQDEKLIKLIRTLVQILSDHSFPIWAFFILEDVMCPVIQELVRYCPPLLHLRSAPWYGAHRDTCPIVQIDGDISGVPIDFLARSNTNRKAMINNLHWYDHPRSYSMEDRIRIRNAIHGLSQDSLAEIPHRPDLSAVPMIMGAGWDRALTAYIQQMSNVHDPGTFPRTSTIRHILDQFYDALTGEFGSNVSGLSVPIVYQTVRRA